MGVEYNRRGRDHELDDFEITGDDPEVFWKYDMETRKVNTSGLLINESKNDVSC
jgi:hypothetical protein